MANVEVLVNEERGCLTGLAFGAEDYITDMGGRRTPESLEVIYARSRVILAARLAGLQALDQVFTVIRDDDAFRRDAEVGRQLGYGGKMCITPRQVEIANEVFSPSAEEVDRSRRLIQAYEAAQSEGRGTIEFEGSMVDEPLLKRARAVLQLVREIATDVTDFRMSTKIGFLIAKEAPRKQLVNLMPIDFNFEIPRQPAAQQD